MLRDIKRIFVEGVIAVLLVAFCSFYGQTSNLRAAISDVYHAIRIGIHGQVDSSQFYLVRGFEIWSSVRLLLLSFIISVVLGYVMAVLRNGFSHRLAKWTGGVTTFLESIPDTMYVVITAIVMLYLFEHFGMKLPIFPDTFHPSFQDTIVPALALALPCAFYLERILSMKLEEDIGADFYLTAKAKGLSDQRIFFRHVMPNAWPILLRTAPVLMGTITSSALFVEFFYDYQGLLFHFLQGVGWGPLSGISTKGLHGFVIPLYQVGSVFTIGLILVLIWIASRLILSVIRHLNYDDNIQQVGSFINMRVSRVPLAVGCFLLSIIVVAAIHPSLFTSFTPSHIDFGNILEGQAWPLPPSHTHPFGTDDMGHDMLSITAYGARNTTLVVIAVGVIAVGGSLILAALCFTLNIHWLATVIRYTGQALSGIPVLFVTFLLLYTRNKSVISLANQTPADVVRQVIAYILVISILEIGRGAYAFYEAMQGWQQYIFIEGAKSIGQSRTNILFVHLRSWLLRYTLEYSFTELARVLAIMMQLGALHLFAANKYGIVPFTFNPIPPPPTGSIPALGTWTGQIGLIVNQYAFVSYAWLLIAPVMAICITMIGCNLVGRGLRGKQVAA